MPVGALMNADSTRAVASAWRCSASVRAVMSSKWDTMKRGCPRASWTVVPWVDAHTTSPSGRR